MCTNQKSSVKALAQHNTRMSEVYQEVSNFSKISEHSNLIVRVFFIPHI